MKISFKFITILLTISLLQGCQGGMNKQTGGTLLGGATGAWLGSRLGGGKGTIATTAVGALAGAFIGGQIGKDMDDKDRQIAELTSQKALEAAPTGSNVQWRNPDNGHTGVVTPTKTFQNERGENCREYTHTVVIGGKQEKAYGRACRQPNGYWKIAG